MTTAIMESIQQCAQTKTARIEKGTSRVVRMTKHQWNKVLVALGLCPECTGKLRELNDNYRKCAACGHVLYVYPVTDAVLCVTCRNASNIDRQKVSLDVLNGKRERI